MDVICKEKFNVIFWRKSHDEEWNCEDLDVMINAYQDEPYTEFTYWEPVKREDSEKILYHVYFCQKCNMPVLSVDEEHGYKYCPHCGRAIWRD